MFVKRRTAKGVAADVGAEQPQPLAGMAPGRRIVIVDLDAGRELWLRLESMGIFPDIEATVMSNYNHGPLLLAVGDNRIMLGRGMAEKVIVQPCENG